MSRRIWKILSKVSAAAALLAALFFLISYFIEYRPKATEDLYVNPLDPFPLPDTLTIVTWNIGYAGLGDDMDLSGKEDRRVRGSKKRTEQNLREIISVLKRLDADIILLQEVDISSRRSYRVNQRREIAGALSGYKEYFAFDSRIFFVPFPTGKIQSGLLTLSRHEPVDVTRYGYPPRTGIRERLFGYKHGILSARFITRTGDTLMVNNIHNAPSGNSSMQNSEVKFLGSLLLEAASKGTRSITGGDWGQSPPGYKPSAEEPDIEHYRVQPIETRYFESFADFYYGGQAWNGLLYTGPARGITDNDTTAHGGSAPGSTVQNIPRSASATPTVRFPDKPYEPGDPVSIVDFFLVSRGVRVLEAGTLDLGFHASDHNPVMIKVVI